MTLSVTLPSDFFRKVLGIISAQLLVTAAIVAGFMFSENGGDVLYDNIWIFAVAGTIAIITCLLPICVKALARRVPYNYLNLFLFVCVSQTACVGIVLAYLCCQLSPGIVVIAGVLTFEVTVVMTLCAIIVLPTLGQD